MARVFASRGASFPPVIPSPMEQLWSVDDLDSDFSSVTTESPVSVHRRVSETSPSSSLEDIQSSLKVIQSSLWEITGFLRDIADNTRPTDGSKSVIRRNLKDKVSF